MLAIAAIVAALVVIVLLAREHPGLGYFASFAA
jgi:hypothetical protein